jgi:hypothetical protein
MRPRHGHSACRICPAEFTFANFSSMTHHLELRDLPSFTNFRTWRKGHTLSSILLVVLFPFCLNPVFSQGKFDNVWVMGYSGNGIIFSFDNDTLSIDTADIVLELFSSNAAICDSSGNLLFYSNGANIANSIHQPIENSDLELGLLSQNFPVGVNTPQLVLILPMPEKPPFYFLFHKALYNPTPQTLGSQFFYSIIDMSMNNGLGGILEKNILVLDGVYLDWGELTACKHANGRDWWILLNESDSNRYYKYVLSPDGLISYGVQEVGFQTYNGLGQASFSPNGMKYARLNLIDLQTGGFIDIYDFDRCEGLLSNQIQINYIDSSFAGGLAFSPNSRFLYVPSTNHIFQYDMEANNIPASKEVVGVYDGFMSPFWASFYMAQLAPDGKIYINAPNGVDVMHVINNPNEQGLACDFAQHSIELPTYNAFSLPNYPYFNLGALEGSPCDTLGTPSVTTMAPAHDKIVASLYPNPVEKEIQVRLSRPLLSEGGFRVYDAIGREALKTVFPAGQREFQVRLDIPPGIYFYVIDEDRRRVFSGKFVKE